METRPELDGNNPLQLFHEWMKLSEKSELNDPNAAALATCTSSGIPSVRMVLVKNVDTNGFGFYTNAGSQKGHELSENPQAALCFHWKSLRRQVRVAGEVTVAPNEVTDEYFHSRSRRSQIGAAVSKQSQPLENRQELEAQVAAFEKNHAEGQIPRPDFWQGYRIHPRTIEFWIDGPDRLHDRLLFTRSGDGWTKTLLYP